MALSKIRIVLAAAAIGMTTQAWAFGGIGCTDLPEHDRAVGALEGMTGACDMTVERARQILGQTGDRSAGGQGRTEAPYPSREAPESRN